MNFPEEQIERYSRHFLLKEIGVRGQEKLRTARVFVVGAGGLGSAAILYLAAAGIGKIGIADNDEVELSNLQRQVIHSLEDLGTNKAVSARQRSQWLNPDCRVEVFPGRLTAENIHSIIRGYDIVLDGSDNFPTRFLVADYCWFHKIPLVSAAVVRFEGQLLSVLPEKDCPCYRCFIPELPDQVPSRADSGVLGPAAGVMGSLQATETIKMLLGIGRPVTHHLLVYRALPGEFRLVKRPVDPNCPLCGPRPTIRTLIQYKEACRDQENNPLSAQL